MTQFILFDGNTVNKMCLEPCLPLKKPLFLVGRKDTILGESLPDCVHENRIFPSVQSLSRV